VNNVNLDELHRQLNRADFLMSLYRHARTDEASRRLGALLGDQFQLVARLVARLRVGGLSADHLTTFRQSAQQPQLTAGGGAPKPVRSSPREPERQRKGSRVAQETQSIPGDPS